MIAGHSISESVFRPARLALTADTAIGDSLPRSHPTFASRSNTSMVAVAFSFALAGAMLAIIVSRFNDAPVIAAVIAGVLAASFAVPISVGLGFSTSLQPIRDLARGAERVAAGDYNQRLPVVQDDDLGALAASFNRMQAGLAERRRLHAAFGTYVVIAGTIGGGGKLEFTLIGDTVNVAARVEQLTKTHRRHHPAHPAVPRRSCQPTARTHRPRITRTEGEVGHRASLQPRRLIGPSRKPISGSSPPLQMLAMITPSATWYRFLQTRKCLARAFRPQRTQACCRASKPHS